MGKELVNSFSTLTEKIPVINITETEEGIFFKEIIESPGKGIFNPNFEHEFDINSS